MDADLYPICSYAAVSWCLTMDTVFSVSYVSPSGDGFFVEMLALPSTSTVGGHEDGVAHIVLVGERKERGQAEDGSDLDRKLVMGLYTPAAHDQRCGGGGGGGTWGGDGVDTCIGCSELTAFRNNADLQKSWRKPRERKE
ncbi:unnamed protein product [Agarophyton chilense]